MGKWVTVEPLKWPLDGTVLRTFPSQPGCYVVYGDGELLYIGQTSNLYKRLAAHNIRYGYSNNILAPWGSFSQVVVKYRKSRRYGEWAMVEARLIKRIQPPFNCVGSVRKRGAA